MTDVSEPTSLKVSRDVIDRWLQECNHPTLYADITAKMMLVKEKAFQETFPNILPKDIEIVYDKGEDFIACFVPGMA